MNGATYNSKMWSDYSGSLRAILDEYARAFRDLDVLVLAISPQMFRAPSTLSDKEFPDMAAVMEHVIGAGHSYVDYIEDAVSGEDRGRRPRIYACDTPVQSMASVWEAFGRMVEVLGRIKQYDDDDLGKTRLVTRWNQQYDLEQMLEHAIVHILRHRRQLERWVAELTPRGGAPA